MKRMNNDSPPLTVMKASSLLLQSLIALLVLSFVSYPVYSANLPTDDFLDDDFLEDSVPIVLSGTRLAQPQGDVPASITVIDRKMIEAAGITELPQIFRLVPGFQVGHSSPSLGVRTAVAYHGNSDAYARRMQVLVDGMSIYSPMFGGVNWYELPLAIDDIEKIEVIRGPNGVTYGSNSFAAVINIITRHPSTLHGTNISTHVNDGSFRKVYARHTGNIKEFSYRVSLESQGDTGFEDSYDDRRKSFINYRGTYQQNTKDSWQFHFAGLNAPEQTVSNGPERDIQISNHTGQVKWKRQLGHENEYSIQLYYNAYHLEDDYDITIPLTCLFYFGLYGSLGPGCTIPDGTPTFVMYEYVETNKVNRINLEYQHTKRINNNLRLVWGAEARQDKVSGSGWFNTDADIENNLLRVFANGEWAASKKLTVNIGTMVENNELTGTDYSPRLALNYRFLPKHTLRLVASKAKRAPSLFESNVNAVVTLGTIMVIQDQLIAAGNDLESEDIVSYEIGYFGSLFENKMSLDLKIFKEEIKNVITFYADLNYPDIDSNADTFSNDGETSLYGWEMQLKYNLNKKSLLSINYAYTKNDGEFLSRINAGPSKIYTETDTSTPEHTFGFLAATEVFDQSKISVGYYYVSDNRWTSDDGKKKEGYKIMDIKLAKTFKWGNTEGEVTVIAKNALGSYSDADDSVELERRYYMTLGLQFN